MQKDYGSYFDALRQHPRMLVGQEVPALNGKEGEMETLRDPADAREWQEAVKQLLTEEVRDRTASFLEENKGIADTVHSSIELFTANKDMVPGTRQFDRQLADRFAAMAKPYELRVEGKLYGFTIPVQPLIDSLRASLAAERAAAAPAATGAQAAAGSPSQGRPATQAEPPQAGIGTKAGSASDDGEDFSTLFGTLGLPNFRI